MTLVARHRYFGLEPLRLRDAANRVLSQVPETLPEGASVHWDALVEDLRLGTAASRAVVDQMVEDGVLRRLSPTGADYGLTDRFREIARARIIEPLPRVEAQMLLGHCTDLAAQFNRTAVHNKYEIEAMAVFGSYMSHHTDLSDLSLGITGRKRAPGNRPISGRDTAPTQGTEHIRSLFEDQSSYVKVGLFKRLQDIPRPFSVIFNAED